MGGRGVMVLLCRKRRVSAPGDEIERRRGSDGDDGGSVPPGEVEDSTKIVPTPKERREARGCIGDEGGGEEGAEGILDDVSSIYLD
jgi:hypothetical protein